MHRRDFLSAAAAVASASTLGISGTARAEGGPAKTVIRMATLAPKGSTWMRVFDAWNNSLKKKTNGELELQFYSGGAAGDERDMVRKMKAGQIDAAAITTVGLGQLGATARSAMVLQAPGVCYSYKRIDAVRGKHGPEFEKMFEADGFKLLGWGDAGQGRIFSSVRPISKPDDMKGLKMWAWGEDPTWRSVLSAVGGVTPVGVGLPEVYPSLRTKQIDAFPGTSIAAVVFQWFTQAQYVTQEPRGIVIGAMVVKKDKFAALPAPQQQALLETGRDAQSALTIAIRKDDDKAFETIVGKGVKAVSQAENMKAWEDVLRKARQSLVASGLYTADLLKRIEDTAVAAG
jgi:TRAP-type C4-dicarboxylate transport system substrate-binding protein